MSHFMPGHQSATVRPRHISIDSSNQDRIALCDSFPSSSELSQSIPYNSSISNNNHHSSNSSAHSNSSLDSNRSAASLPFSLSESTSNLSMTGSRRCVAPFRGCMQIGQRHRSSDFDIEQMELSKFYSPEFVQRIYVIRFAWTGDVNQMMPPEVSAISVLAHRYIAHGQKTFNLEVDLSHPHRGYHCLPVDHDAIHDRVDIQEHSVYARDLLDAEMFVREFNSIRTEYKTIRMLGNIVTCTLSRAFISNNNLVNCQQYICDLFDHLCPCCLGTFYQSGGVCAISRKLMCWECGAIKPHNACMARVQMKYINRAQPNPLMPLEKHLEFNRLLLPPRMSHAAISPAFACGAASSVPNS